MPVLYNKEGTRIEGAKLQEAYELCRTQCKQLGIPYGKIVDVEPDRKGTKRWGVCQRTPAGFTIKINQRLLADGVDKNGLLTTVMHEILHTCPDCWNHGKVWKAYAAKVKQEFGYDVKRTTSAEEKGMETIVRVDRYKFRCQRCGAIVGRAKASAFTKHPENYRCAICGGSFIRL